MKKFTFLFTLLLFTTSLFANNDFLKSLQNNNPKLMETVLIFHKPDCPYCEQMGKLISNDVYLQQKIKEKFNVTIVDISTEEGKKIAQLYAVKAVPTIIKYNKVLQSFSILKGFGSNARFSNFLGLELNNDSISVINRGIPPLCGNGAVEGGEQCDDANTTNGDGCNAICAVESGFSCVGSPSVCSAGICGDGIVAPTEQCDDANTTNGDGCNAICAVESGFSCVGSPSVCSAGICGDGVVAPTEQCDDANTSNGDGCNSICNVESGFSCVGSPSVCSAGICGDGVVAPTEQCDDANTSNGDGCNSICNVESGFSCVGSPSVCSAGICGDGVVAPTEQCDDANTSNGDGCNSICNVESGFSCVGSPSVCSASICGDGIVTPAEQCDDANISNGDGCNSICNVESGFSCVGSPSVCSVLGLEDINNQFVILKAYPNPFSNAINTTVYLKDASEVEIILIDNIGKLIKTIRKSNMTFGENEISIPIDDALQDGLYFMKIQITNSNGVFYETKKLIKE